MARAAETDVREIIDLDAALKLDRFIQAASRLVDYVEDCDTNNLLSADHLRDIEIQLAAHFAAHRDQRYAAKKTADASATFQGQTGMGLDSTQYGQTAKILDVTGCLADLDRDSKRGKTTVGLQWLGTPPSSQLDYDERD